MQIDGKYYRQGPDLAYQAEEEIVYDDKYRGVSIYNIVRKNDVKSIPQMKALLDANGYFGRSRVRRVYKDNVYPINEFKVDIHLIWSNITYTWPSVGVYSMDYNRVVPTVDRFYSLGSEMEQAANIMYKYMSGDPRSVQRRSTLDAEVIEYIVKEFQRLRLIKHENFKVVDDAELREVIDNLLKP